ncbi:TVP38/TMEM64 family protein [Halocalculus aciditolerans]|uniref:TVP38/TMEM64 family protein n=1 Tax=Halocalculus aciditolerans TaxID=1383812 RepID=A0A830FBZ3_9EURY|nr:TVP38/TMEM64 family protein [Halocalculus aciditolerans]GGL59358.1 TVP38/TMEM64 family protein [Halocalculus aciditolerans]
MPRPRRLFRTHDTKRSALVAALALAATGLLLAFLVTRVDVLATPAAVERFVRGFGVLAPLAFVLLQAVQVVAAPIPGQVLAFVAGYLFGPVWGTVYGVTGATIGSYVAFSLARRFGRPYVERVLHDDALGWLDAFSHDHGLLALFCVFLIPGLPDDVVCFVAGLTDLDVKKMTAVAALGRTPGFFAAAYAGSNAAHGRYDTALVVLAALAAVALGAWIYRERIRDALTA